MINLKFAHLAETGVFKAIQFIFIGLIAVMLLTACGPSEQDAKRLGFANVADMKDLQAKGFKTKEEHAKFLGFENVDEMKEIQAKGFQTKESYEVNVSGFSSAYEMKAYRDQGYKTKQEFEEAGRKSEADAKGAEDKAKKEGWQSLDEKIAANAKNINSPKQYKSILVEEGRKKDKEVYCYMYKQALDACATAFDTNKCLSIKLAGDVYKYQSACY